MSIKSLKFDYKMGMGIGLCLLCDKSVNRNKFKNIKQIYSNDSKLVLLSQILHSQIEINALVRNNKNEKISIISNIFEMLQKDHKWNNDFDVVSMGKKPDYGAYLTPNNRSLFSLSAS